MPAFNGTGPKGIGPMTGRGLGPCERGQTYSRGIGRGLGKGLKRGLGLGRGVSVGYRQLTKDEETINIKTYISDLEAELQDVNEYLKDFQSNNK
ncbi:MAG TPA: DUF5320 domain-containing protein [bacterium]|nr:DUF5320 domain-containing protein [bacterium]